jgi:hypothetical protein
MLKKIQFGTLDVTLLYSTKVVCKDRYTYNAVKVTCWGTLVTTVLNKSDLLGYSCYNRAEQK